MTVLANFFSAKLRILNNSNWILQKINFKNWLVCITENNCLSIQQDLSWNWTWACSFKQKAQRMPGQTFRCFMCRSISCESAIKSILVPSHFFFFTSTYLTSSTFHASHLDYAASHWTALIIVGIWHIFTPPAVTQLHCEVLSVVYLWGMKS